MSEQPDPGQTGPRPGRPGAAGAARPAEDLSAEIARAVPRRPGDDVRCTRVGGDTYRCNWWAPQPPPSTGVNGRGDTAALVATTHRVRKSQFLRATRADGRLVITRCPPAAVVDDGG